MDSRFRIAAGCAALLLFGAAGATTATGGSSHARQDDGKFRATLTGYEEVPPVSTAASGKFRAEVKGDAIHWTMRYADIEGGPVLQAHIHFGQRAVNGGVSAFLCSNLDSAPEGVQPCPKPPATLSGTVTAKDVVGPVDQGIAPGELGELLRAMRAGVTYVNVHSERWPAGEIRGQIDHRHGR